MTIFDPDLDLVVLGGGGHVGLPLSLAFAQAGLRVGIYDTNQATLDRIAAGEMPFMENGADELLREILPTGRLSFGSDGELIARTDQLVVVMGTPVDEFLGPSMTIFEKAVEQIAPYLREGALVVQNESTSLATIQQLDPIYADFTQSVSELRRLRRAFESGADIIVATPGRLLDLHEQRLVNLSNVEILVLDEPVQAVDFMGEAKMYELISTIRKRHGCGILMVSHDLAVIAHLCERIAVMAALNITHELLGIKGGAAPANGFDSAGIQRRISAMQSAIDRAMAEQV